MSVGSLLRPPFSLNGPIFVLVHVSSFKGTRTFGSVQGSWDWSTRVNLFGTVFYGMVCKTCTEDSFGLFRLFIYPGTFILRFSFPTSSTNFYFE